MLSWKIKVVDLRDQKLTWRKAFLRYFYALLTCGVGLLWCFVDNKSQALYDRMAGTKVIFLYPKKAKNDAS
jgi:uncharacterized RDD family membrane protein YckC